MDTLVSSKLRLVLGVFAALLLWPAVNFAQTASSFSGDAIAAKGKIGTQSFEVDHLKLPMTELIDPDVKSIPGGTVGGADGSGIKLSTSGTGLSSLTTADVGTFQVVIGGHTIIVNSAYSEVSTMCPVSLGDIAGVAPPVGYVGSVTIDESYSSTTDFPGGIIDSQTFPLGFEGVDGTVSVNQLASSTATAAGGDVVLNAVQIDMKNGDQIVVGSSHAGVTCPKAPAGGGGGCKGKVTGGGVFMLNGKRQTFGLVAGTKKDGTTFGNFNYVDHGSGAHLQGTVQSVIVDFPTSTTTVTGTLKTGGGYTLVVMDNGEPGENDTLSLTSGPVTTGTVALDGGNIQLHKGCKK